MAIPTNSFFQRAAYLSMPEPITFPSSIVFPRDPIPYSGTDETRSEPELAYVGEHSALKTLASPTRAKNAADESSSPATDRLIRLRSAVLEASEAAIPSRQPLRRALIDSFFTNIAHTAPVVSRSEVCELDSSILLQQAVCLAGSLTRYWNPQHRSFQENLYEKIKILLALNVESNMLVVLQSMCLLTLWSPNSANTVSLDSPWHANGSALRLALQMGLHRRSSYTHRTDGSCRRRIWWMLYVGFATISPSSQFLTNT